VIEKRFIDLTFKPSDDPHGRKFGIDMKAAEGNSPRRSSAPQVRLRGSDPGAEEAYRIAWEATEAFRAKHAGFPRRRGGAHERMGRRHLTIENEGERAPAKSAHTISSAPETTGSRSFPPSVPCPGVLKFR